MALQTDLSRSPYFDDYDSTKNFYRVLYRPSVAVQTRELNQMQTILQDQIDKFGRHVFKEGSVIEGCSFTFDQKYNYVKINDNYANGTAFTITDFVNNYVTNSNGLKALIINTQVGYQSQDPDLNTIYVKYLNTGSFSNGSSQSVFANNETLTIATSANVVIGNVVVATVTNSTGFGYAFTTTSGTIFQKGFFISVTPQTLIVSKYDNQPNNISVGFNTLENIITPEADSSLYDNAAGSPNYAAPGAHRLQLVPTLVTKTTSSISNTEAFFSLCDFKSGYPVSIKNDPQYAALGADMARRSYETNGDYVVYPFVLSTEQKAYDDPDHATYVNLVSSRGLGYVKGYRVEYINNNKIALRKSTDYEAISGQVVSTNFGYYINVDQYAGEFDVSNVYQVELHNSPKNAVLNGSLLSTSYSSSTRIGTAFLRGFKYSGGSIGTGNEIYNAYLFNVQMNPGQNFSNVLSIIYRSSGSTVGIADVIQTLGPSGYSTTFQNAQLNNMIFPFGQRGLKLDGFNNQQFVYRDKANASFSTLSSGSMTINLPASPHGTGTETFFDEGTLSNANKDTFIVVPTTSGTTTAKTGTVAVTGLTTPSGTVSGVAGSTAVVGSGTTFTSLTVGNWIIANGEKHVIASIANTTYLTIATPWVSTVAANSFQQGSITVTGTSTAFLSDYMVGDFITFNSETHQIAFIANNTSLKTVQYWSSSASSNTHAKTFPAGVPLDFTKSNGVINRSIVATANSATFTLGEQITGSFNAFAYFDTLRSATVPIKKNLKRNVYVSINCASAGTSGTFSLGLPDVYQINNIFINNGGTYSNAGVDYSSNFTFDNGQRDGYYDLASITVNGVPLALTSRIIVDMDVFVASTDQGVGFFSANSYPVDDVYPESNTGINIAANTTPHITTAQIPQYTGSDGSVFDLRDCIDFRPQAANTATYLSNSSNWMTTTPTENPSNAFTVSVLSTGAYLPSPDSNFQSDIQHYLRRKDKAVIATDGTMRIIEGKPSNNPPVPLDLPGSMTLGVIDVPPYPSLSTPEAASAKRYDYAIAVTTTQNKRYTMQDIGVLANKIDNLQYYTSLTLLEKAATDLLVRSSTTGQNRFQNGFLVDPFRGHDIGNVLDPTYRIAIDPSKTEIRPQFFQFHRPFKFANNLSTNIVQTGGATLLKYNANTVYIQQQYASKFRNCIDGNIFVWSGAVTFDPPGDTQPDLTKSPDVVTNIDLASNFTAIAAAYGTQWGNWQTTTATTSSATAVTGTSAITDRYGNITQTTNSQTVTTTQQQQQRVGTQLGVSIATNNYNLGTYVTDVSILPYVKSIFVNIKATGLKPNTRVYAFMNDVDVNAWMRQTDATYSAAATFDATHGLITDSTGTLYAKFTIPPNTFKATTLVMNLYDVPNPITGLNAITTQASGTFYATNISTAKGSSILSAREAVVSVQEVTDQKTVTTQSVTNNQATIVIPGPPPPPVYPPYYGDGGGNFGGDGGGGGGGGCGSGPGGSDCGPGSG